MESRCPASWPVTTTDCVVHTQAPGKSPGQGLAANHWDNIQSQHFQPQARKSHHIIQKLHTAPFTAHHVIPSTSQISGTTNHTVCWWTGMSIIRTSKVSRLPWADVLHFNVDDFAKIACWLWLMSLILFLAEVGGFHKGTANSNLTLCWQTWNWSQELSLQTLCTDSETLPNGANTANCSKLTVYMHSRHWSLGLGIPGLNIPSYEDMWPW